MNTEPWRVQLWLGEHLIEEHVAPAALAEQYANVIRLRIRGLPGRRVHCEPASVDRPPTRRPPTESTTVIHPPTPKWPIASVRPMPETVASTRSDRRSHHGGQLKESSMPIDLDDLFEDRAVLGAPSLADEYGRKAPGEYDANGDHCTVN